MKTKLLKMALCAVALLPMGAWATSSTDGTPTATLDLHTLVNGNAFQYDGNYLYVHANGSAGSGEEWISVVGGQNAFGTTIEDDDATAKGFKTLTSFISAVGNNITRQLAINASESATRYIVYRVTNCTGLKVLCNTNSAGRTLVASAYVVSDNTRAAEAEKTSSSAASTTGAESFELTDLTASKVYDIVLNTTATSNIGLGELMFEISKEETTAWGINFAEWATSKLDYGTSLKNCTYSAQTRYTVGETADIFYSISCEDKSSEATNFNSRFLQARNSATGIRYNNVSVIGLYANVEATTTYVIRDLQVGDVMYVAAANAPTMVGTYVGDKFVAAGLTSFEYRGSRNLTYNIYQYFVTTAGDQMFTLPGKTLIYEVGMKKSGKITAGGNGYSMFSSTSPVTFSGATAYTATSQSASNVTFTEVSEDVIPANTGVMFKAAAKGDDITITYSADAGTDLGTNLLQPVSSATESFASGTNYVLATSSSNETKFYSFTDGVTLSDLQGKCYLNISSGQARELNIEIGDVTGIDTVDQADKAGKTFKVLENGRLLIKKADGTASTLTGIKF